MDRPHVGIATFGFLGVRPGFSFAYLRMTIRSREPRLAPARPSAPHRQPCWLFGRKEMLND